jgi:hypothetical protein
MTMLCYQKFLKVDPEIAASYTEDNLKVNVLLLEKDNFKKGSGE